MIKDEIEGVVDRTLNYEEKDKLPDDSGVYFLWTEKAIYYIGFASNIKKRWRSRRFLLELVKEKPIFISYLLNSIGLSKELEKKYIQQFHPLYNSAHNNESFTVMRSFKISASRLKLYEDMAKIENKSTSEWIRDALDFYVKIKGPLESLKDIFQESEER